MRSMNVRSTPIRSEGRDSSVTFGYHRPMSSETNKALARVWFDEVMNGRDPSAIDRAYAEDYAYRGPSGGMRGRDEAKKVVEMLYAAMPDRVSTVEQQIAEGSYVVTRWVSRGTNTGPLMGHPPTGGPISVHGITISRIVSGLITEDWEIIQVVDA